MKALGLLVAFFGGAALAYQPSLHDAYEWLVPLEGAKAARWVKAQNQKVAKQFLSDPRFPAFQKEILKVLQSNEGIVEGDLRGQSYYALDKSGRRQLGLWRRTSFDVLLTEAPSVWEPLLDFDALSAREKKTWTFKSATCLGPAFRRCLVLLSVAGADVAELREFDLSTKKFVPKGFHHRAADTQVQWLDADRILIATDFGPKTLTAAGYPLQARIWKRGEPIAKAKLAYESKAPGTTGVVLEVHDERGTDPLVVGEWVSFREVVYYLQDKEKFSRKLDFPQDSAIREIHGGMAYVSLLSDWQTQGQRFSRGSVIALNLREAQAGKQPIPELVYATQAQEVVVDIQATKDYVWINSLREVVSRVTRVTKRNGKWLGQGVAFPDDGTLTLMATARDSNNVLARFESFLVPDTHYALKEGGLEPKKFASIPPDFNSQRFKSEMRWTTSEDGTRVPYFLIQSKKAKADGKTPTLIWGYGAGNVSYSPFYLASIGKVWLERGGAYVAAVVRGGGELGPDWRKGGYRETKPHSFEDLIAVAQDLVERKVTSPAHLGIYGGSWGGLLVSGAFIKRPALFGAVVAEAPMTDMLNYTIFHGEWAGEFGDPADPRYTDLLRSYSPYHNVKKAPKYPPVLFTSARNDDRMHPAHSRRLVAKLQDLKQPAYYWETDVGGHDSATGNSDASQSLALRFVFFAKLLGLKK